MLPSLQDQHSPTREIGEGEAKAGHVTSDQARDPDRGDQDEQGPASGPPSTSPTQASSRIEPDIFDDNGLEDEFYPESTNTSYLTSIASDIRRGIQENGRTYGVYGLHKAWIPSDDLEVREMHCSSQKARILIRVYRLSAMISSTASSQCSWATSFTWPLLPIIRKRFLILVLDQVSGQSTWPSNTHQLKSLVSTQLWFSLM
jgi:hypothetical protein